MYIRDPVLNDIQVTELEEKVIDLPEFQRLRSISQLGFSNLVYPGANGTRFEHSLGTMKITKDISDRLYGETDQELSIAGLLHDIGHTPFSHQTEQVFIKYLHKSHEQIGYDMIRASAIRDVIQASGISLKKTLGYFRGIGRGAVITGPLGSDRLDYLMRDAYQTGVAYGIIDYTRIRNGLTNLHGMPAVRLNSIDGAESMLIARYYMLSSVYFHHTSVIAASMLCKALEACIDNSEIAASVSSRLTDSQLMSTLINSRSGSKLASMVAERKLFKRAYYLDSLDSHLTKGELEDALEKAGIDRNDYIVEIKTFKGGSDDVTVVDRDGGKIGSLSKISPLFNALLEMLNKRSIVVVACSPANIARARRALHKSL